MGGGVIVGSTHYFNLKTQIRPLKMAHVTLETLVITKYNTLIHNCTKDNIFDIYHVNN